MPFKTEAQNEREKSEVSIYADRHERFHRTRHRIPRQEWYSLKQAAIILGVCEMTVWRAIKAKRLKAVAHGGTRAVGKWKISHEALCDYMASLEKI